MNNILINANIYFIVTTIAIVLFTLFFMVFMFFLIKILIRINRISKKIEENVMSVNEGILDMVHQVKESFWFNLFFPKSRKQKKN
jgi:membrane protein YdbS with pleckstrin-like domain